MNDPYPSNPYQAPNADPYRQASPVDATVGFSHNLVESLRQTRPWVLFLSIMGCLVVALMMLGGAAMLVGGLSGLIPADEGSANMFVGVGVLYIVMGIVYVPPLLFLFRYAGHIKKFVTAPTSPAIESAMAAQKSFWKSVGILFLIMMILQVVFVIGAMAFGFANAAA